MSFVSEAAEKRRSAYHVRMPKEHLDDDLPYDDEEGEQESYTQEPQMVPLSPQLKETLAKVCHREYKKILEKIVEQGKRQDEYKKKIFAKIGCPAELMPPVVQASKVADELPFPSWLFASYALSIDYDPETGEALVNQEGVDFLEMRLKGEYIE